MRRDLNLIRDILLAIEAAPGGELLRMTALPTRPTAAVHFHVHLLLEAGLITTSFPNRRPDQPWIILRLTWRGYDWLDAVRDPLIWRTARRAAQRLGTWSLDTIGALAKAAVLAKAADLGITLAA